MRSWQATEWLDPLNSTKTDTIAAFHHVDASPISTLTNNDEESEQLKGKIQSQQKKQEEQKRRLVLLNTLCELKGITWSGQGGVNTEDWNLCLVTSKEAF